METSLRVDVRQYIEDQPVGRYQLFVALLILLVIACDGIDVASMAFVAPEIIKDWGITRPAMGPALSSVFFGLAIGAFISGPVADRFGRKLVVACSVLLFGAFTAAAGMATNLSELFVLRLLGGLGLGAALPNAVTMISEFAPARRRSLIVTVVYSGFTLGATAAGLLSAWLIPALGWRHSLELAGLAPVVLGVVLMFLLPESPVFLAVRGGRGSRIRATLQRLSGRADLDVNAVFFAPAKDIVKTASAKAIVSREHVVATVSLCLSYLLVSFVIYCLFNWMPVMARQAGFSLQRAAVITSVFTLAGPVGSMILGAFMDRTRPAAVLVVASVAAAASLWAMSSTPGNFWALCTLSFVTGFFVHGTATGLNALASRAYPAAVAATGVSWMQGVGKFGGISSGFAGGLMLGWGWSLPSILLALAVPILVCGAAMFVLDRSRRGTAGMGTTAAATQLNAVAR